MEFLSKLEPFLLSEDIYEQKLVLHILADIHPFVPAEWTEKLLKDALESKEKAANILHYIDKFPLNEGAVKLLIQGLRKSDKSQLHLYKGLLNHLETELAYKYRAELKPYLSKRDWGIYRIIAEGEEEELWEEYGSLLADLEEEGPYKNNYYSKAKLIAKTMVEEDIIEEWEIENSFKEQEKYFEFNAILSVYMIRLMNLQKYAPFLVSLMDRDEDVLLEEVADTLISFQSDEVVEMVLPYARKPESSIFAISVISGTKTPFALKVLKELFNEIENLEDKSLVLEALCHQLSKEALPEIEQYMKGNPESYLVEIEDTVYGFYKIVGESHPDLLKWKQIAEQKDKEFHQMRKKEKLAPISLGKPIQNQPKIGRNDPCPCGSGKKYKKCCG